MDNEKQPAQDPENICQGLLFPKIFQTFRMAIQPSKLITAFLAILLVCAAGWLMDRGRTVVIAPDGTTELECFLSTPDRVEQFAENNREKGQGTGVFVTLWQFNRERFHGALESLFATNFVGVSENIQGCFMALVWAFTYHPLYCIVFFVIKLAVISVAGGAICRIAALEFASGEKPGLTEALRFGIRKFFSFFGAPLVPVGIVVLIGAFVALLGLVGNIPRAGELIMAIFTPLALLAGGLMAVVVIGAVAGFDLMFPAVAYDGSDCLDAISRSFNYIYSRPWRMSFYTAAAAVYGAICYLFVRFFAWLLLSATHFMLTVGLFDRAGKLDRIWAKPAFASLLGPTAQTPANWTESLAALMVNLCVLAVIGLLVAFIVSFFFSANTVIYSLMRYKVDNAALEDVYRYPDEIQAEPTSAGSEPEEGQEDSDESMDPLSSSE